MQMQRTTIFPASPGRVWELLQRPETLLTISKPLMFFKPLDPPRLPEEWEEGEYKVRMWLFGFVPFGWQVMGVEFPDADEESGVRKLRDNGYGGLIRKWDHIIEIEPVSSAENPDEKWTKYTDRVTIDAGILTPNVWLFAKLFYAHRQRRWKQLLSAG
jgi:hypothetical protein